MIEKDEVVGSEWLLEFLQTELAALEVLESGRGAPKKAKAENRIEKRVLKKENESAAFAQALVAQSSGCMFRDKSHEFTKCDKFFDLLLLNVWQN